MTASPPMPAVNLADNTNQWGAPPAARDAIAGVDAALVAAYPSADGTRLVARLSEFLGVGPDCLMVGCGSDDVLDAAFGLAAPGAAAAWPEPTFSMVPILARAHRLVAHAVPMAGRWFDLEAILDAEPALTYLCSPANPTGTVLDADLVEATIARAPGLVVVDEAYLEFAGTASLAVRAAQGKRLIVVRTFSKAWGLAGVRAGYAVANRDVVARLRARRGPFGLNAVAERATVAALDSASWMREHVAEAVTNRRRLAESLRALGLDPLPSDANFLCVPVPGAVTLAARLAEQGVLVRAFPALPGIGDAIRITVAPWPMLERCLRALVEAGR